MSETPAVESRPGRGFDGLWVLSLESRRGTEMARLIETYGGHAVVAPSMREVPLESNVEAVEFVGKLAAKQFDIVIFLTGVGTRALARVAESVDQREEFVAALRGVTVAARGPKPVAVLREMGVRVTLAAPEPNTWRGYWARSMNSGRRCRWRDGEWPCRNTARRTRNCWPDSPSAARL